MPLLRAASKKVGMDVNCTTQLMWGAQTLMQVNAGLMQGRPHYASIGTRSFQHSTFKMWEHDICSHIFKATEDDIPDRDLQQISILSVKKKNELDKHSWICVLWRKSELCQCKIWVIMLVCCECLPRHCCVVPEVFRIIFSVCSERLLGITVWLKSKTLILASHTSQSSL